MSKVTIRCIGFDWRSCSSMMRDAAKRAGGVLSQRVFVLPATPRDRLESFDATLVSAEYMSHSSSLGVAVDLRGLTRSEAVACVCEAILKAVNRYLIEALSKSNKCAAP